MIYTVRINNKEYEVEVERGQANLINTTEIINTQAVATAAPVNTQPVAAVQQPAPQVATNNVSGEPVKAPMPGTIVDIKVNVGSKVTKGQMLFILEAMKMENEIFSPCDGTIAQILVSKGSTVATNDIIMIIQ